MIIGTHTIIYTADPEATRAFFRDVLELPHVDAHDGWLVLKLPPGEVAAHPLMGEAAPSHQFWLICDDIGATVAELTAKGVEFAGEPTDAGFGIMTTILLPGGAEIGLYEARHPTAYDLP